MRKWTRRRPGFDRLLPLGSIKEMGSHKGYGLGRRGRYFQRYPLTGGGYGANNGANTSATIAWWLTISKLSLDVAEFKRTMDEWLVMLKTTKPHRVTDRVLYPACRKLNVRRNIRPKASRSIMKWVEWLRKTAPTTKPPATSDQIILRRLLWTT